MSTLLRQQLTIIGLVVGVSRASDLGKETLSKKNQESKFSEEESSNLIPSDFKLHSKK